MADTSILSQAANGGNNPGSSSLIGAPNPLFRAMNQQTLTNLQSLSSGNVGTFLQSKKLVNGDIASIINASSSYFLGDKTKNLPPISKSVSYATTSQTFIPIIIKTDFKYKLGTSEDATKYPLYIVFDSTPENITLSKSAEWVSKNFLGRPEPIFTYNNSSPTTFQLTGKFFADSFKVHGNLLKLSDYIMSLVTPSEFNYMPSPVTVFIGEWKQLRCLVNTVNIKYQGPWVVKVDKTNVDRSVTTSETAVRTSAASNTTIPSHAPYIFEATFTFTVVNPDNNVKYSEQVVSSGIIDSSTQLSSEDIENIRTLNPSLYSQTTYIGNTTGLYNLDSGVTYTFENSQISRSVSNTFQYTTAAQNLNLYADANNIKNKSDLGIISNAVSNQMLSLFQKANPSSTNTPATTSSLNPFKKLF